MVWWHTILIPQSPERRINRPRRDSVEDTVPSIDTKPIDGASTNDEEINEGEFEPRRAPRGQFVTQEQDPFLNEWVPYRDQYLLELLRLEGLRGRDSTRCPRCPAGKEVEACYRCKDCLGGDLVCKACCVRAHANNPFHSVAKWNGRFFEKATLQSLGLVLQVGHHPGTLCENPRPGPTDFLVVHTNGLHPVTIHFCNCDSLQLAGDKVQQLLRYELYPATIADPTTCFTFRLLEQFHMITLQAKTTAYDFYLALQYLTDNVGLGPSYDRLKAFMRVMREWRHLKLLKRAGRGHEPGGVNATKPGELALQCPACPRPGFNIPDNWDTVSDEMKYLYTTFVAIDANFRLKRRAVSSEDRDPALGSGWGFFVENQTYHAHLLDNADQQEISTCTGFAALARANSRWEKGYAATGVGMAIDARHGFIFPNGVGDLQRGERYCNMDWIVASALSLWSKFTPLVLSYDIVCQWSVHLRERLAQFPPHLRLELPDTDLRYAIPKYHFNAHKNKDHNQYSLNLMPAGRTDGEEVERNWSRHDQTSPSTREMGPGSRQGTLEDHFGYANWRKFTGICIWLAKSSRDSKKHAKEQGELFGEFCAQLDQGKMGEWISDVVAWEKDRSLPDPYYREPKGVSEAEIRRRLAAADDDAAGSGEQVLHEISPASLMVELLEIEDQQRKFRLRYPKADSRTAAQDTEILEKRTALRRRILAIREVQSIYMPCVPQLVARHQQDRRLAAEQGKKSRTSRTPDVPSSAGAPAPSPGAVTPLLSTYPSADADAPESQPLFLPHFLPPASLASCATGVAAIEEQLREAQLHDSLEKLRMQLHIKSRILNFKGRHVRHQQPNTKIRRHLDTNEAKIKVFAEKYRAAWRAKLLLSGAGEWQREWRVLEREDVRTMLVEDDPSNRQAADANSQAGRKGKKQMISQGRAKTSWIWMGARADDDDKNGVSEALRHEFLSSRARCMRFAENVQMVEAEKERTEVSLEKTALVWDRREGESHNADTSAIVREGLAAYAARQAHIRRQMAARCRTLWGKTGMQGIADPLAMSSLPATNNSAASVDRASSPLVDDEEDPDLYIAGVHGDSDDE